jgi:hypothetical protein
VNGGCVEFAGCNEKNRRDEAVSGSATANTTAMESYQQVAPQPQPKRKLGKYNRQTAE